MPSDNVAVIVEWIERVWNRKEPGAIAEFLTDETIAHGMGPNGTTLVGIEPFAQAHALFCEAFPDIHVTVDVMVAEGDKVATSLTCRATHKGDALGVAATGQVVEFRAMTIARIKDGKVIEGWNILDLMSVFQQIGAMRVSEALP
ncbi:MAG: ester cyclase [Armatimonadota bacterium]